MTDNREIWNKRLNWVRARDSAKNKYERLSYSLKIAHYDYVVARKFSYKEGQRKAKVRISDLHKRINNRTLKSELKAIDTLKRNLEKQIDYDKKLGVTFSSEKRNGKEYLYRQKRGQKHEYVAKDWSDLETKQRREAEEQVLDEQWAAKGLAPIEIETFDIISKEVFEIEDKKEFINKYLKTKEDRYDYFGHHVTMKQVKANFFAHIDPIISKAADQLGMYHKLRIVESRSRRQKGHKIDIDTGKFIKKVIIEPHNHYKIYRLICINPLSKQEIKNILRATRKALIRRGNINKKLESIARVIGEGEDSIENVKRFIIYLMNQIGLHHDSDESAITALIKYVHEINARDPKSMYAVLNPMEINEFAEAAVRKFKAIGGHF